MKTKQLLALLVVSLVLLAGCTDADLSKLKSNKTNTSASSSNLSTANISSATNQTPANGSITPPSLPPVEDFSDDGMKLTWVGAQKKIIPSLALSPNYSPSAFEDGQLSLDYSNDELNMHILAISESEMQELKSAAYSLKFIEEEYGMPASPVLSFQYFDGSTTTERVLSAEEARELSGALQKTLAGNEEAIGILEAYK
ncbi:MAG: hypothetical protein ABIH99_05035 [Candidatus Micrarchaeota archaeon]